jgi:hypothetical protein
MTATARLSKTPTRRGAAVECGGHPSLTMPAQATSGRAAPARVGARVLPSVAALCIAVLAVLVVLIVVAAIGIIFRGLYRSTRYFRAFENMRTPRERISDAYDTLKTGDVILFASTVQSPANSMLLQLYFSHAGVVLRESPRGEEPLVYLSESSPGHALMPIGGGRELVTRPGSCISPLLVRLKYYTGMYYVMRLERPLEPAREEALKAAAERAHLAAHPYPSTAQLMKSAFAGIQSSSRHCFQNVTHLLAAAGLIAPDDAAYTDFIGACRAVCGLPGAALGGGHRYREPAQLIYDLDAKTEERLDS